jgi:hypothetical protein
MLRPLRSPLKSLAGLLALVVALAVVMTGATAHAQVTDADRNAARDLYIEGESLRQQGRFADALERYNRSLQVFPAPTTAFRIAQCKAALGQLVEAAEEYRVVTNTPLPQNPTEAFVKAKNDAATELALIEPRIPKVRINIQPYPLQGLQITVDNVAMSVALVGVARPVNPGQHRITATAPGYQTAQTTVDVRERQQPMPEVTLTLQPGGGPTYTTQQTQQTQQQTQQTQTYQGQTYQAGGGYYQQGGAYPYNQWVPPRPARPQGPPNALWLGVDGAISIPFGDFSLTQAAGVGGAFGVDVGFRLARIIYLGAQGQFSFFGGDGSGGPSASSYLLAALFGLMSGPDTGGIFFETGVGFRGLNWSFSDSMHPNETAGNFILGLGAQIKVGTFRLVPKADLYVGLSPPFAGFFALDLALFWEVPLSRAPVQANVQTY